MSIRKKVTLSLMVILGLLVSFEYVIEQTVILPSFAELQREEAIRNVDRCEEAINRELYHISASVNDWAPWNDTYEFIQGRRPDYIESNLTDSTFTNLGIDLVCFYDLEGRVVWSKIFDPETEEETHLKEFPKTGLDKDHFLLSHSSEESYVEGILLTELSPILISSRPILKNDHVGPIKGTLMFGTFIDKNLIEKLSTQTNVEFSITTKPGSSLSASSHKTVTANGESYCLAHDEGNGIEVSHVVRCLDDQVLNIVSFTPDDILSKGKATSNFSMLFSVGVAVLTVLFVFLALNQTVLKRVAGLCGLVHKIEGSGDLSLRTEDEGKDELGSLGSNINSMLDRLETNEKELTEATAQAELANRTKSAFLASMSHEVRTPMNAIHGFAELLADEKLTDEQKSYVEIIHKSTNNLICIINDILDISKIEAGEMQIEKIECSLEDVVLATESMLRPKATEKGLKFDILQCDDLPGTIISDPTRLRQCLINLVNNAIKFTDKGHVYVNLSIEQIDNDSFIRFDVEDTGIGMTDEQQQIVFEEFQQADQTITRKFGGTGLGLSITKRLTEMLGGHISLKSAPGKGSVFTMHVPLEIAEESTPMDKYGIVNQYDTAAVPHGNIYGVKILVAEDARANQKLLEVYLQKMGFFVKIVENGKDAVEEALSGNYDLILMDIQMPVMNGYEATKLIREHGLSIPVIAVTANAMAGDEEKCLAAGCDDYMPKPISGPRLYDLIGQYLAARA